jgi:redox-sensitive bicupin YhaK (pirin superfamily)
MSLRALKRLIRSEPTIEGAGVHLRRAFGFDNTADFDPFLLLDDFRSDVPDDYLAGFPWHPHRGIQTITYLLAGSVEHGDSMGNRGVIGPPFGSDRGRRLGRRDAARHRREPHAGALRPRRRNHRPGR